MEDSPENILLSINIDNKHTLEDEVNNKTCKEEEDPIRYVIAQAKEEYSGEKERWNTLFYRIVLGGNVKVTKKILEQLKQNSDSDVINWLLDTCNKRKYFRAPVKSKQSLKAFKALMFIFFALVSVVLTPIFYAVQGLLHSISTGRKQRISSNIKLPLAYAAFSHNKEMLSLFLENNVDINETDMHGNNIFHYIADLSAEFPERAIEIFKIAVSFINECIIVKQMLSKKRNSAGLTAIEYASKFGSPALLTNMLNHPDFLLHTEIAVGQDTITVGKNTSLEESTNFQTRLEFVDVSMYERYNLMRKSVILNLLSDRDIANMSPFDLHLYNRVSIVGRWMAMKTKQMFFGIGTFHLLDFTVTIMLLYIIIYGIAANPYFAKFDIKRLNVTIHELRSFQDNKSTILPDNIYHKAVTDSKFYHQRMYMKQLIDTGHLKDVFTLYNKTAEYDFNLFQNIYKGDISNMNITSEDTSKFMMDKFYYIALQMEEFKPYHSDMLMLNYMPTIIMYFASELFKQHAHLLTEKIDIFTRERLEDEITESYNNFSLFGVVEDYEYFYPSKYVSYWEFQKNFCLEKKFFKPKDVEKEGKVPPPPDLYWTSCDAQALMNIANEDCQGNATQTYNDIRQVVTNDYGRYQHIKLITFVFCLFTIIYIIIDLIERMVYIFTCISSHTHVSDMIMSLLTKKVPGSYTRKQLNIGSDICLLLYSLQLMRLDSLQYSDVLKKTGWTVEQHTRNMSFCLIIGMILRFVMHIHSLRLLPNIGHFVITTFMMALNLLHFSAVYTIVLFAFSVIFTVLLDHPTCPIAKSKGFEGIFASMFSTFKLTFGHGEFEPYYSTPTAMLAYSIFIIICCLLLLNLIIAIMSTTATNIMADPWKDTLWRVEWLDEALSVEYTCSLLYFPLMKWRPYSYWSHKKAGFHVTHSASKGAHSHNIYIEVFRCPALE